MIDYIIQRPDHLFSEPPKTEEPFSTPRSWHMLSDALTEYGAGKRAVSMETLKMLAYACVSDAHAGMFLAYTKTLRNTHLLDEIIAQKAKWPGKPEERDVLYFWRSLSGQNCLRNFQKANRIFPEICFRLFIEQKA